MKNKLVLGAGACGLLSGLLLASGGVKGNVVQVLSLAGLLAVPPAFIAHLVSDSSAARKVNEAQKRAEDSTSKLGHATALVTELGAKSSELAKQLATTQQTLSGVMSERDFQNTSTNSLKEQLSKLERILIDRTTALETIQAKVEELQAECDRWELEFHSRLDSEAEKRFQIARSQEIQRIQEENDELTREAMSIVRGFRQWGIEVDSRLQDRGEFIKSITNSYNNHLEGLKGSVSIQVEQYLKQIELLHCKVATLQQKLEGDLVEPEYGQFGYALEGKIANDIARKVWKDLQIPLAVKGYQVKPDGSTDIGYGYSRSIPVEALLRDFSRHSGDLAKYLGIHKITGIRKHEFSDLIVLTFRREPAVKADTIKLLAGTPEQFLDYISSHPFRYRLIADPGQGKTPTTAVMVSEILKVGGTRGNTGKGKKIPNTLVTVSCPDVESSQKDTDYPLEIFLKYGNTTAAVKSFSDAEEDWQYRKRDTNYAQNFFQLWIWDELDNTLNNADDPKAVGERFKNFLKQAHHTGVGWIVSGQSVMTKQIPGFMDDDRELFTQIIIGTSKIRKYLEKYGKKILSDKVVNQLFRNLEDLESYIEDKNSMVTDAARLLRLALVLDDKSPKLYFLPNLDSAKFDSEKTDGVITQASQAKRQFLAKTSGKSGYEMVTEAQNTYTEGVGRMVADPPFPTIGGSDHSHPSDQIPHCPHCGGNELKVIENGKRYQCKGCTKRFVTSKVVWK